VKYDFGSATVGVIGLGYVGLPLAIEFGKKFSTVGFDINPARVAALVGSRDVTGEISVDEFSEAKHLKLTLDVSDLAKCNFYIVTVPTPVDANHKPDLSAIVSASHMIGELLSYGDIVIYESTVYPGVTEEQCVPILEKVSGLRFNIDFYCGYSPERINPGDKERRLPDIVKVTSGSTLESSLIVDHLYQQIISAGTFRAGSIKVAEAAKVIENTQRDVNIALINELAIIFNKLGIDTQEVLEAAGTKWNFLPFKPGLVGGHCISVDPYYLAYKSQSIGYEPDLILAARQINDNVSAYVVEQITKELIKRKVNLGELRILIMGLTFKENCPDIRNSKIIDVAREFSDLGINVDIYDPVVNPADIIESVRINLISDPEENTYHVIILAVAHRQFIEMGGKGIRKFGSNRSIIYDLKNVLARDESDMRL
jgi:UDP-N-acetyl-D-galactosamine dehydrogenase